MDIHICTWYFSIFLVQQKTNFPLTAGYVQIKHVFIYFTIIVADRANCMRYDFMRIIKNKKICLTIEMLNHPRRSHSFTVYYHRLLLPILSLSCLSHSTGYAISRLLTITESRSINAATRLETSATRITLTGALLYLKRASASALRFYRAES